MENSALCLEELLKESAVIVGVSLFGEQEDTLHSDLIELKALLKTLEIKVVGEVIQKRQRLTAKCLLGSGKVLEIKELAEANRAEMIVFDRLLSPPQVRNLEKMTGKLVFDRTAIILEIFHRHAKSNLSKTQVEIARLEYLLPRLTGAWTHFQRQAGGGVRSRGMGETQIEVDRRRARERISRLQRQLEGISRDQKTQRKGRSNELKVALVGYTNSGKTSIMTALTKADSQAQDKLFATLDASIKVIDPRTRPKILLSDTVGFIRNLPHGLIESFKSTLAEVTEADLLVHVVAVNHPRFREHMETTELVLHEIGADNIPQIVVFNKVDEVRDEFSLKIMRSANRDSVFMSAFDKKDIKRLRERIYHHFKKNFFHLSFCVSVNQQSVLSMVYNSCLVLSTEYTDDGNIQLEVQASEAIVGRLEKLTGVKNLIKKKAEG